MTENNAIVLENNTTKKGNVSKLMQANKKRRQALNEKRKMKQHSGYAVNPDVVHSNFFKDQKVANWDDIKDINNKCTESLLKLGTEVIKLTEGLKLMEKNYLDDFQMFNSSLNILATDMKKVSDQLAEYYEPVKDRSGYITNEDELMECFTIYQNMAGVVDTIDNVMMPNIYNLSSMYESAYAKFSADNADILQEIENEEKQSQDKE